MLPTAASKSDLHCFQPPNSWVMLLSNLKDSRSPRVTLELSAGAYHALPTTRDKLLSGHLFGLVVRLTRALTRVSRCDAFDAKSIIYTGLWRAFQQKQQSKIWTLYSDNQLRVTYLQWGIRASNGPIISNMSCPGYRGLTAPRYVFSLGHRHPIVICNLCPAAFRPRNNQLCCPLFPLHIGQLQNRRLWGRCDIKGHRFERFG
jgi:hypothetical protein